MATGTEPGTSINGQEQLEGSNERNIATEGHEESGEVLLAEPEQVFAEGSVNTMPLPSLTFKPKLKVRAKKYHSHLPYCANCGIAMGEGINFCPNCGQQNHDLRLPIGHVLEEVAEGIWHFDGKFWGTALALASRPGKLTLDFLEGRRVRYVPPIRLYVFVAFVFFYLVNTYTSKQIHAGSHDNESEYVVIDSSGRTSGVKIAAKINLKSNETKESVKEGMSGSEKAKQALAEADNTTTKAENKSKSYDKAGFKLPKQQLRALDLRMMQGIALSQVAYSGWQAAPTWEARQVMYDSLATVIFANPEKEKVKFDALRRYISENRDSLVVLAPNVDARTLGTQGKQKGAVIKALPTVENRVLDVHQLNVFASDNEEAKEHLLDSLKIEGKFKRVMATRSARLIAMLKFGDPGTSYGDLAHDVIHVASLGMFIFMPVVALFLWLLFRKQRIYFVEHLIHSVHMHVALFLILTPAIVMGLLEVHTTWAKGLVGIATLVLLLLYPLLSIKRVYGQKWVNTIVKFTLLAASYSVCLLLFVIGLVGYSFLKL
jgi:hypothetical protein